MLFRPLQLDRLAVLCLLLAGTAPLALGALKITTTSLPNGTVGSPYNQSLDASGGSGGNSWSISLGILPAGLTLSAGGQIAGTPTATGSFTFTAQVTDTATDLDVQILHLTITPAPLTITTTSLPNATANVAYSQTLTAGGGSGTYTWSRTAGTLPSGIALAANGTLSGTPNLTGTSNFTVQVKDSSNATDTQALSITVVPPLTISTTSLPGGMVGASYSQTLAATGGTGGYTWSTTAGSLPAGTTISAAGAITGTPTTAGTANFTAQVKDSSGTTTTQALSIAVAPPPLNVTTGSLPGAVVGTAYNQTLAATGGTGGYSWSTSAGSVPAGLTLSAAGAITGTPTTAGTANFTAQVKDSSGTTATKALSIAVAPPPLSVTTSSLPTAVVGTAYSQTLAANGGTGGYTWSTTAGSLPAGLTLSPAGAITGTPTTTGTANFTVQVKDSSGTTATQALTIAVAPPPLNVTTSSLSAAVVGTAYSQSLAATGGTPGYTWSTTAGSLPAGLTLSTGGIITGTPTTAGTANFTVQVKDSSGTTATQPLTIAVAPPPLNISSTSLPAAVVGTAYSQTLAATGGTGGYAWSTTAGSLPAGLTLSPAGAITGTPTTTGTASFTVQVKDSAGTTATQALTIVVAPPSLNVSTSSLPGAVVGTAYSQTLAATGGTGGYTWSTTAGSLPAGLTLSPAGAITGTPTTTGTASFTVQVKDSSGTTATQALTIAVAPPSLNISTTSLPGAVVGTAYSQTLAATGGTGGNTWSTTAGSLPAGLTLSPAGAITGTPTTTGTASFTVQVKDSSGATATQALTIAVAPPQLTVTTNSLPGGVVGTAYNQTLAASGGTGGNTWSTTSGSLPAGLTLSSAGAISGTPTATGTSTFTVQVKDSAGTTATQQLTIAIAAPQLTVTTSSLPAAMVGAAYNQSLAASGGTGGFTWSTTAGSLPAGITLASSGAITGTPTATGTSTFTVQVKDSSGTTATQQLTIAVAPPQLTIMTTALPNGTAGMSYSQTLTASGGSGSYTWSVSGGSLPPGLILSTGGVLSGSPAVPGNFTFTVAANDGTTSVTRSLTVSIGSTVTITSNALASGRVGTAYNDSVHASGGVPPYTWEPGTGQLPTGLSLNAQNGSITGTPTVAGTFSFTIRVTDSASGKAEAPFSVTIGAPLSITTATTLPTGSAGSAYSLNFAASGGASPYSWSETGPLPTGLTLSASGTLAGTPTQVGNFPITVQVTDGSSATATASFTVQVVSGLAIATPPVLPPATVGLPYTTTLQAVGGSSPFSWVVTAGSLPAGINFNGQGQISGTATASGDFSFTVQVTDGNSHTAQKQFALSVKGSLAITSSTLPAGNTGNPYSQTLTATGGTPPYSWSVTAGTLPNGLALEVPTGTLAGTPTATGTFTFTVTVTDSNSATAQEQFSVTIGAGLSITTAASLPSGTTGAAYTVTLAVTGGQSPYTWSLTQGALPGGLALNGASGVISGVPTGSGTFNFTIGVTDSAHISVSSNFTIVVGLPAAPLVSISGLPATLQPLQQATLGISLASPYPADITGTVSLSFKPSGSNGVDDPSVQFSSGGRSATFTIPANATQATFGGSQLAIQAGSVMGTVSLAIVSLQSAGSSLSVPTGPPQTSTISAAPPVISNLSLVHVQNGIQLQLVGVSDTRDLTRATVTFQPAPGSALQTGQLTVALADVATAWFQGSGSAAFGGQFALTLPFTFQGDVSLSSVSIVLTNSSGDSSSASANY